MKHIHRFFVSSNLSPGEITSLEGDDSFHATNVLRLGPGDPIELAEGSGRVFSATIVSSEDGVRAETGEELGIRTTFPLTVVQAVPKGKKMDLIVEKLSELGVAGLVPVHTGLSLVKNGRVSSEKLQRWRRIAKSAAAQAKRPDVMAVADPITLTEWLAQAGGSLIALVTEEEGRQLGASLGDLEGPLALIVGPEAGFSADEIDMMLDKGVEFASLGALILRTETAAMVATTVIMHRLGAIG